MTIEQTDKIDFISIEKVSGDCNLVIADHLPWENEKQHLLLLQEKLNVYLRFIESGEIYQHVPKAKDKKIRIELTLKAAPTDTAIQFLILAQHRIEAAGIGFNYEVLQTD